MMRISDWSRRRPGGSVYLMGLVVAVAAVTGCAIWPDAQMRQAEQEAYESALHRHLQGHVYEKGCPELLPRAGQVLGREGYREVEYKTGNIGLTTGWRTEEQGRHRMVLHAQRVGAERCSVQIWRQVRMRSGQGREQRDVEMELEVLRSIDEKTAERIRVNAEREARRAVTR